MKTSPSPIVTCSTCIHARLHRYGSNPLLAACEQKPQPTSTRFPFEVEVALAPRHCAVYKKDAKGKDIEHKERAGA